VELDVELPANYVPVIQRAPIPSLGRIDVEGFDDWTVTLVNRHNAPAAGLLMFMREDTFETIRGLQELAGLAARRRRMP